MCGSSGHSGLKSVKAIFVSDGSVCLWHAPSSSSSSVKCRASLPLIGFHCARADIPLEQWRVAEAGMLHGSALQTASLIGQRCAGMRHSRRSLALSTGTLRWSFATALYPSTLGHWRPMNCLVEWPLLSVVRRTSSPSPGPNLSTQQCPSCGQRPSFCCLFRDLFPVIVIISLVSV